jgi:hypothetical protein
LLSVTHAVPALPPRDGPCRSDLSGFVLGLGAACRLCLRRVPRPRIASTLISNHAWRAPEPCEKCGRPVICDARRRLPKHVVCSDACRLAVYRAIGIARRRSLIEQRPCKACRKPFTPKRCDARYCSAACKQKAYRRANHPAKRADMKPPFRPAAGSHPNSSRRARRRAVEHLHVSVDTRILRLKRG